MQQHHQQQKQQAEDVEVQQRHAAELTRVRVPFSDLRANRECVNQAAASANRVPTPCSCTCKPSAASATKQANASTPSYISAAPAHMQLLRKAALLGDRAAAAQAPGSAQQAC